jgi:hypothetical protein
MEQQFLEGQFVGRGHDLADPIDAPAVGDTPVFI